MGMVI